MSVAPLKVGLVGAGGITRHHLPNLLALGADVWVYSEHGAEELVAKYGGHVAATLDDLLANVDYVDIATPTHTHFGIASRALAAGKNVISEKPLVRTDDEARELRDLVEASGKQLYPAQVARYFPEYVKLKKAVDDGLLGDLAVLRFSRSGAFPTRGAWYAERDLSGGIIMDLMLHDIDLARWIAGEVTSVSAVSTRTGTAEAPIEAAHVLLTHTSGAITHVAGLWGAPHLKFTTEYSVSGTGGTVTHSSAEQRNYIADLASNGTEVELTPATDATDSPYMAELREFFAAFNGGAEPRVSIEDGIIAVGIANAALESLATGQPVSLVGQEVAA